GLACRMGLRTSGAAASGSMRLPLPGHLGARGNVFPRPVTASGDFPTPCLALSARPGGPLGAAEGQTASGAQPGYARLMKFDMTASEEVAPGASRLSDPSRPLATLAHVRAPRLRRPPGALPGVAA